MTEKKLLERLEEGTLDAAESMKLTDEQRKMEGSFPCILVMNKVDLITNKRKMRNLQAELNDLNRFEHTFHVSAESNFGIEALREYLMD